MFKPNLDKVEDFLELIAYECPEEVYGELANFQPDCHSVDSCYDCWRTAVLRYQVEQSLKSMNDEEDN